MKKSKLNIIYIVFFIGFLLGGDIYLPQPNLTGDVSLEEAITSRRSVRTYTDKPLLVDQVSQLLWASYGITSDRGFHSVPSAGATFPSEIFLLVRDVTDLQSGLYSYNPYEHSISAIKQGDFQKIYKHFV